jgi:hypothetical protein
VNSMTWGWCLPPQGTPDPADSDPLGNFRVEASLYRGRSAVEREFGRLKHQFGLVLRTRGLAQTRLHADLVMLARLGQALNRARVVPHAA